MRRLAAVAVLAGLVVVPAAQAAPKGAVFGLRAVGNPKLGYFVYSLAPGTTKKGAVIVSNVGTTAGTVKLFTADGTTGPTSGTVYKTDVRPTQTGAWVSLSAMSFALTPRAHRKVPFTVRVPRGAKPGQWVAGIVAETSQRVAEQKPGQKARVQIKIRDLTIVAVQVNVPGPKRIGFTIGHVTTGGSRGFQKVFVHLQNTGNMLAKPRGTITIYDKSGAVVETLPFTLDTFLPQTAIDYPVLLKKALRPGDYSALVRLTVPGGPTAAARPHFSVTNTDVKQVFSSAQPTQTVPGIGGSSSTGVARWIYFVAAAVAAALLLGAAALLTLRRRRRRAPEQVATLQRPTDEITAPPPDLPATIPAPEPEPEPGAPQAADCDHHWEVAYDQGRLGDDGVWRFPHRCRSCGLELLARDVADATEQARN